MFKAIRTSLAMLLFWTCATGFLYPLTITGIAQTFFPHQANGSIITNARDIPTGSRLLGQSFDDPAWFWGRPSATQPTPYNGAASSGSNLGPTNPALIQAVRQRVEQIRNTGTGSQTPIPIDLVTASASGLDPDISIAAARYQILRIAKARHLPEASLDQLIATQQKSRNLLVMGEPRVNVLLLNLALEQLK
jgi:K+-transporting ATPase ATPase C chain